MEIGLHWWLFYSGFVLVGLFWLDLFLMDLILARVSMALAWLVSMAVYVRRIDGSTSSQSPRFYLPESAPSILYNTVWSISTLFRFGIDGRIRKSKKIKKIRESVLESVEVRLAGIYFWYLCKYLFNPESMGFWFVLFGSVRRSIERSWAWIASKIQQFESLKRERRGWNSFNVCMYCVSSW